MNQKNKNFRILLLNISSTSFFYEQIVIPFGLVSLASFVDCPDYEIKGMELNWPAEKIMQRYLKADENILRQILAFSPDVVAMSTYAENMYNVIFWADVIKRKLPNCFVVVGGNHASYIAKETLEKCSGIDAVVRFEGEIPFKMLCEKLAARNTDFGNVPNLIWRKDGHIIENRENVLLDNIESLPIINRTYFVSGQDDKAMTHADVISARGCPFHCTFCDCNHYWQKTHRTRGVNSVIKELKQLLADNPNVKSVRFRDESITLKKPYCMELCRALIDNNINLEFHAHSRLDGLDEELIATLAKAGFKLLFIGVESGSEKVLRNLKKGIKLEKLAPNLELLRKYGVNFRLSFMSSTPGETFFDTLKTVKLVKKLKLKRNEYYMGIGIDIYPGTEECNKFLQLNPDYRWISNKGFKFNSRYFAKRDLFGNIINPKFRQYSLLKSALIFPLLSPDYFFERVKSLAFKKIKKVFINKVKTKFRPYQTLMDLKPTTFRNVLTSFSATPYKDVLFVTEGVEWVTNGEIKCLTEDVLSKLAINWRVSGPVPIGFPRQAIFYPSVYFLRYPHRYILPKCRIAFPYYHGYPGSGKELFDVCFNNLKKYHHRVTRIQASNSYMKNIILQSGIRPEKVFLIPIAIKGEYFSLQSPESKKTARQDFGIPQNAVVVGSFQKDGDGWGEGLNPKMVKGPDIFLKTISILKNSIPEIFVLLSGPARGYVKKGLEELSVPYKHVFLKDYSKIGSLYHCLDVYMVASRQEGGPKAVLESMASGVPLVTTRVGQAMDLVQNEQNGMIVNVEDTEALAFACEKILNDEQLRKKIIVNAAETAKMNTYTAHIPLWRDFFKGFVDFKGD